MHFNTRLDLISQRGESRTPEGACYAASAAEDLARRLAEKVRQTYGEGAEIERLILVASVTEENGSQRAVVEAQDGLPLYAQAGTLRHGLSALTRSS